MISHKHWVIFLLLIVLLSVLLRLPGVNQPYHQDEYKWADIVAKGSSLAGTIPHPPLSEKIYVATDRIFGNNHLRFTPFLLSIVNLLLLFFVMKKQFGPRPAYWATMLFAASFYSILASLIVDTDGQILPLFFLLATYFYYRFDQAPVESKWRWLLITALVCALGLLVKLSFIIAVGTLAVDFIYQKRHQLSKRQWLWGLGGVIVAAIIITIFLASSPHLGYWLRFLVVFDRHWLQTIIQSLKALLFVSPLLLFPLIFLSRTDWSRARLWWLYILSGLGFYLVVFDFSAGALDRYFQFLIVPLAVLGGLGLSRVFDRQWEKWSPRVLTGGVVVTGAVFLIQWLLHFIPPHYPKTEWFGRVSQFKWNFLFPFSGGSGPLGFYVSFLFIALSFIVVLCLAIWAYWRPAVAKNLVAIILMLGLVYNGVFISEYLFGVINGHAPTVLLAAIEFIGNNQDISKVITYNDTGAYELRKMGKYERRIYAVPEWEEGYKETLNNFSGHYLVVDIPRLNPESLYTKYFSTCTTIFEAVDKNITAIVYDCREAPDIL